MAKFTEEQAKAFLQDKDLMLHASEMRDEEFKKRMESHGITFINEEDVSISKKEISELVKCKGDINKLPDWILKNVSGGKSFKKVFVKELQKSTAKAIIGIIAGIVGLAIAIPVYIKVKSSK